MNNFRIIAVLIILLSTTISHAQSSKKIDANFVNHPKTYSTNSSVKIGLYDKNKFIEEKILCFYDGGDLSVGESTYTLCYGKPVSEKPRTEDVVAMVGLEVSEKEVIQPVNKKDGKQYFEIQLISKLYRELVPEDEIYSDPHFDTSEGKIRVYGQLEKGLGGSLCSYNFLVTNTLVTIAECKEQFSHTAYDETNLNSSYMIFARTSNVQKELAVYLKAFLDSGKALKPSVLDRVVREVRHVEQ